MINFIKHAIMKVATIEFCSHKTFSTSSLPLVHCCFNEGVKCFPTLYFRLAFIYSESLSMFVVVQPSVYFVTVGHKHNGNPQYGNTTECTFSTTSKWTFTVTFYAANSRRLHNFCRINDCVGHTIKLAELSLLKSGKTFKMMA